MISFNLIITLNLNIRNTNSQKLLEIVKAIPIEKELEIQNGLRNLDKGGRNAVKREMRKDTLNEMNKIFNFNDEFDTLEITSKQTVWCLTEAGPFKNYLNKYEIVDDKFCRFCRTSPESAEHLLFG